MTVLIHHDESQRNRVILDSYFHSTNHLIRSRCILADFYRCATAFSSKDCKIHYEMEEQET